MERSISEAIDLAFAMDHKMFSTGGDKDDF